LTDAKPNNKWPGIESNPDVMNQFASKMGLNTANVAFLDVFGLDEDLLMMLPSPVYSVILLFPSKARKPEDTKKSFDSKDVFFLEQVDELQDACGTIAMVHALANNATTIGLQEGALTKYLQQAKPLGVHERGVALANFQEIKQLHSSFAAVGATRMLEVGATDHHFVCFTQIGEYVIEIDGCKTKPIKHDKIEVDFVRTAAKIIQREYMSDPTIIDFSMIALAAAGNM